MLSYSEAVNNQDFAAFKGGLAAVSDSEIKFFTSTGRTTLTLGSEYTDPKIVTGDSRALVYDSGKSSFAIYNSFICEYSESLDLPISSADMSDNGRFAVVTRSKSYTTSVRIYESDFSLISEYSKNDYIVSAKLSPDGKYVAVLSLDAASGEGKTTLSVIRVGSDKLHASVTLDSAIPYSCAVLSSDRIAVFLNDRVAVFSMNGRMISEYHYPERISAIACSESGFTLLFNEKTVSGAAMIAVFDSNGKAYTPKRIEGSVKDVEMYGDHVYLLCEDTVMRINALTGAERSVDVTFDDASLTVINDGEALLCTSASAYYIRFE
jgi:WD40 repeat protein